MNLFIYSKYRKMRTRKNLRMWRLFTQFKAPIFLKSGNKTLTIFFLWNTFLIKLKGLIYLEGLLPPLTVSLSSGPVFQSLTRKIAVYTLQNIFLLFLVAVKQICFYYFFKLGIQIMIIFLNMGSIFKHEIQIMIPF